MSLQRAASISTFHFLSIHPCTGPQAFGSQLLAAPFAARADGRAHRAVAQCSTVIAKTLTGSIQPLGNPALNAVQGRDKRGAVLTAALGHVRTAAAFAADLTGDVG